MGRAAAFELVALLGDAALAHHGAAQDEGRPFLFLVRGVKGLVEGLRIVAVHLDDVPAPGAVLGSIVFFVDGVDVGRQLDTVAVVEHNQVVQAKVAGDAARALRDFFLNTSVRDIGVGLVCHRFAEARGQEALGYRAAHGHGVALAQRARGILDAAAGVDLRVSGRRAAPLAELAQFVDGEFARQRQHGI